MSWNRLHSLYQMPRQTPALNLRARYNGCPTQDFAVLRLENSGRSIAKLRWGLIPSWAKDVKIGARMINARAETVHERPAYRTAFRQRRCLIPADGWLEWREEDGRKQPWFISARSGELVSFAGLWERWKKGDAEPLETFTVLTTAAAPNLVDIHDRQPSILDPDDFEEWLAPHTTQERLLALARRPHERPYAHWRVSRQVNNPRNDHPDLLLPLSKQTAPDADEAGDAAREGE